MAQQLIQPTFTETLLAETPPELIEVNGLPTTSFEDGLLIADTVAQDVRGGGSQFAIPRWAFVPTVDLSSGVEKHPFAGGGKPEFYDGLDFARAIGQDVFDTAAQHAGYIDFLDMHRAVGANHSDADFENHWRLYDGGLIFDVDRYGNDGAPTLWEELLEKYRASEDPTVMEYFKTVAEKLRINAAGLFRCIDPTPMFVLSSETEQSLERKVRVGKALNMFLIDRGYTPDHNGVVMLDMATKTTTESTIAPDGGIEWRSTNL